MAKRRTRQPVVSQSSPCPCGLDAMYGDCCGALHQGKAAATAQQLMRSRYTAFVVRDARYLLQTWSADTRPPTLRFDDDIQWTGLEVLTTTAGTPFHTEGTVEFRAHFTHDGTPDTQQEDSHFTRENGVWVYTKPLPEEESS
ncbi:YchJ family protein [Kribbella sp. NBC_00889]|uniref:YchJ family protein n=1 Tax=Kribbella sp. NBC_00889 TaxID=2975974 RepID=UPI003868BB90|nr:YchJ family metal-binding protein [Kribbella sp. NBC_00889]